MKPTLLLLCSLLTFSAVAEETKTPYGEILVNNAGDELYFNCTTATDLGECVSGRFLLLKSGSTAEFAEVINPKPFEAKNSDVLREHVSCRNKTASGKFLSYTKSVYKGRSSDDLTIFASINQLMEKTPDASDKLIKYMTLPMTFLIDDVLHLTVIPFTEGTLHIGKKTNTLVKTKRQLRLVKALFNQSGTGEFRKIGDHRFKRFVRSLKEAVALTSCKAPAP